MLATALPPGPKGSPLSGNLPEFRRDRLEFLTRCARQYGDVVRLRFGWRRIFLLAHPDLIEQVLVGQARNFRKHFALRVNPLVFGNGLLTSESDFWLRQRRLIQPAFNRGSVAAYAPHMVETAQRVMADWRAGETRDIKKEMEKLTLAIAAKTLFDADASDDAQEVGLALQTLQDEFVTRFGSMMLIPWWAPTPQNLRVRRVVRRLDDIIYRYIEQSKKSGDPKKNDLLSLLLRARDENGRGMTEKQVRDEAMTLFLAGHETTALGLSWTWYLLARHPHVEQRLLQELESVLDGRPPTAADISSLVYTEQVLLESMRLFPPVYAIGREALNDCQLGGFHVPRGHTVIMPQWVLHHDERFFPAPWEFRPERWTDRFKLDLPKFAYFPFAGGPRVCIGNTFAMMEMALVLAAIAPHFSFKLRPGQTVTPTPSFTLQPVNGLPMRIEQQGLAKTRGANAAAFFKDSNVCPILENL